MFCYQCEQTARGTGCTDLGVCGKDEATSTLQDLLVHAIKGVSQYAHRARSLGAVDEKVDNFVTAALFTTVTNVNFDAGRLAKMVWEAAEMRDRARLLYESTCRVAGHALEVVKGPATWIPAKDEAGLLEQGKAVSILVRLKNAGATKTGLEELLTYGVKGTAAYAYHAAELGEDVGFAYAFFHEALDALTRPSLSENELLGLCLRCGEVNLRVMERLDAGHTRTYGHPVPTRVRIEPVAGKAIVVSGHDLKDLEELLKQTADKGINIYTHGEMLPAHGYPGLKKYQHLVGNYGGAWQNQKREFADFPGAILMTTNCIQEPQPEYRDRIFTCGLVGWPGVRHISNRDFTPVIEAALKAPGFMRSGPDRYVTVGFGHQSVLSVADQVISAVKAGRIRHFFLIGGCDGAKSGRNYYTRFAQLVPSDCVILTLACGKYRFNKLEFGEVAGIPRLLDLGQCNDAYSAIKIALALAGAFNCSVNDLPLSLVLSWYEQKAVCILLTLLYLGIKNIRLGPSLPAFVAPEVLKVLSEKFGLMPITTAENDLESLLKKTA